MAWGNEHWHDDIGDRIYLYYALPYDVLFVGAAGTGNPFHREVMFPARHPRVLAVSSAHIDGSRPDDAHHEGVINLIAYIYGPTVGISGFPRIEKTGGTSAASALVAGVATLVRARYPSMRNHEVWDRLQQTRGTACGMPWSWNDRLVNAVAAVGGPCFNRNIAGPYDVQINEGSIGSYRQFSTVATGGGRLQYEWSNGTIGPNATYFFRPGNYDSTVTVVVRDLDVQGVEVVSAPHVVRVTFVPRPPATASIDGPAEIRIGATSCVYSARPTLGFVPVSYQWSVDNEPAGVDSPSFEYVPAYSSATIRVRMTDGSFQSELASLQVVTAPDAPPCLTGE